MKICILGGDKRQLQIINELKNKHEITLIGYDNLNPVDNIKLSNIREVDLSKFDSIIFPVSGVDKDGYIETSFGEKFNVDSKLLINTKKDVLIFTGIISKNLLKILETGNREAISLMKDEEVIKENTIPTVEGIIADVIYNTEITINNANVFIIGYGNIGKSLLPLLETLGARVTLGVENLEDVTTELAIETSSLYDMKRALNYNDIIINTAPALVLDEELLNYTNKEAYILDVSSYPYGVDFECANKLNLKSKQLPGIPSKVAPVTSGLILSKKIKRAIGGVNHG